MKTWFILPGILFRFISGDHKRKETLTRFRAWSWILNLYWKGQALGADLSTGRKLWTVKDLLQLSRSPGKRKHLAPSSWATGPGAPSIRCGQSTGDISARNIGAQCGAREAFNELK